MKECDALVIEFFIPLKNVPTVTHQQKKVAIKHGKPVFYESDNLKQAKRLFLESLADHVPEKPLQGPIRLVTKWLYGKQNCTKPQWKPTRPDTDNLIKLFKDCMTKLEYWHDDAQVCSEITEKYWNPITGIWVHIETLEGN